MRFRDWKLQDTPHHMRGCGVPGEISDTISPCRHGRTPYLTAPRILNLNDEPKYASRCPVHFRSHRDISSQTYLYPPTSPMEQGRRVRRWQSVLPLQNLRCSHDLLLVALTSSSAFSSYTLLPTIRTTIHHSRSLHIRCASTGSHRHPSGQQQLVEKWTDRPSHQQEKKVTHKDTRIGRQCPFFTSPKHQHFSTTSHTRPAQHSQTHLSIPAQAVLGATIRSKFRRTRESSILRTGQRGPRL